jgi:hypothetical protein
MGTHIHHWICASEPVIVMEGGKQYGRTPATCRDCSAERLFKGQHVETDWLHTFSRTGMNVVYDKPVRELGLLSDERMAS